MSGVYETTYRADRRKHKHRCRCCWLILNPGDRVVMARVANRKTWALHIECAERTNGVSGADPTWRDCFEAWSLQRSAAA